MKIVTLIENTAVSPDLEAEHGLSLFIRTRTHNILFDMGQTDAFARNAQKLGVNLGSADLAVLSHGHYDHGGGLPAFLKLNDHAPVYLSRHAFGQYYNGTEKYIGLAQDLSGDARLIPVGEELRIAPGLTLFSCNDRPFAEPLNPYGLNKQENGAFFPDDFLHEHYLLIEEDGLRVLISGCSHKGILNVVKWFRPDVLVGGFHFMKLTDEAELTRAANALLQYPTQYYTGHCTGSEQYALLKTLMGEQLDSVSTGKVLEIRKK